MYRSHACLCWYALEMHVVKNVQLWFYLIERMETEKYKEEKVCESGFLLGRIEN
jgi:hypothetical protein